MGGMGKNRKWPLGDQGKGEVATVQRKVNFVSQKSEKGLLVDGI
jgi:hypothetical protein